MAKLASILQQRFRKKDKPKMTALAEQSSEGKLTVFSGMFGNVVIGEKEEEALSSLLQKYALEDTSDIAQDLKSLVAITSEVKAINHQAAILHGERIKSAQQILKKYRDGAFTAWLLSTYGNRQTPYNFLQYYEFYLAMPKPLHPQIESMPRQAVYTLASRDGPQEKKEEIIRNYNGESKQQMITLIRSLFPLDDQDGRRENLGEGAIKALSRLLSVFELTPPKLSERQKADIKKLMTRIKSYLN